MSNSMIDPNQIPILKWYVDSCDSKNGYPKNMCLRKRLD